jgi:hypothetical protein
VTNRSASTYTNDHTSSAEESPLGPPEKPVRGIVPCSATAHHLVWGRVVPDIPDFCRELVTALAED